MHRVRHLNRACLCPELNPNGNGAIFMLIRSVVLTGACGVLVFSIAARASFAQDSPQAAKVIVESDGTVKIPAESVPLSSFLSPEAKAYVTQHLHDMQDPEIVKQDNGVPRFMKGMLARDKELFAVDQQDAQIGGVHAYVYSPKSGISEVNRERVLINLHGGGFSGCWPGCAELESIPISALMQVKVVSVDYREGPEHKFPAVQKQRIS